VSGAYGGIGSTSLTVDLRKLNAADSGVKTFSGLDLSGSVNGHLALQIPKSGASQAGESDLTQANGTLVLKLDQLLIKGGTVTVPIMGQPTPFDLPRVSVGNVEARLKFERGLGKIEKFQGKGDDLELLATGTLTLAKRLDYAQPNIDFKLKADPDFVKRLGIIGSGLSMLPTDKENAGFRVAKITGFLARPAFNPGQ
jgi:type II secretion system protein N